MKLFGPPNVEKLEEKGDIKGLVKVLGHKDAAMRREAGDALSASAERIQ